MFANVCPGGGAGALRPRSDVFNLHEKDEGRSREEGGESGIKEGEKG